MTYSTDILFSDCFISRLWEERLILTAPACIIIALLQAGVFFVILQLIFSLWDVSIVVPAVLAGLIIPVQFYMAPRIIALFFVTAPEEKDKRHDLIEKYTAGTEEILKPFDPQNLKLLVFDDDVPLILSFGGIAGKRYMVISTGLADILSEDEFNALVMREYHLALRSDTGAFTVAAFLPFLFSVGASLLYEMAKQMKMRRGPGTSHLAGVMLEWTSNLLARPLFSISRERHCRADQFAKENHVSRECLENAVGKIAENFIQPVKEGQPFRKRIFQGLRSFPPFDYKRWVNCGIWREYLNTNAGLMDLGRFLEKNNHFTKQDAVRSTHPPLNERFAGNASADDAEEPGGEDVFERLSKLCSGSKADVLALQTPLILFLAALVCTVLSKRLIGMPFVLYSIGMIVRFSHFMIRRRQAAGEGLERFSFLDLHGGLIDGRMNEKVEAGYYFIKPEDKDNTVAITLRQFVRSEDALLMLSGEQINVRGVLWIKEIPFADLKELSAEDGRTQVRSAHGLLKILAVLILLAIGGLLLMVEIAM